MSRLATLESQPVAATLATAQVVRWNLTGATSHLFSELSWWTGKTRSVVASTLLFDAVSNFKNHGPVRQPLTLRGDRRTPSNFRLPTPLVELLSEEAAARGWSMELLIEHLASEFLTGWLAVYARDRVAPLPVLTHKSISA